MKHGLLLITLFIAATALTSGQYSSTSKPPPTTTTPAPTTTTPAPTTTTPAPTTTTHAPNTTTHAPNTTTHAPNTTTHAPNTTTHAPNTTTTIAPNTTTPIPAPTPSANLTVGKYNSSQDGKLCILADFAIGIRVNTSEVNDTFIVQPSKTTSSGGCSEKTASISLLFSEGGVTLKFLNNEATQKIYVEFVEVDLTYAFKTGVSRDYSGKNESLELFTSAPGHYYSCSSQTVYLGNGLSLDLTHNKIQAFNFKNNEFGTPDVCKADQPDYRVPIAVGIILIILIVIVVIAYLISRKRRTDGYQSL
ncbi:macrosialin [Danio aesculapii]|uniref:macrosialin n=1 Tax=Danio aesculapii TaxID=1142201 RepID=UPI0024C0907E|nr:macrosialin [Danio aesculapii]